MSGEARVDLAEHGPRVVDFQGRSHCPSCYEGAHDRCIGVVCDCPCDKRGWLVLCLKEPGRSDEALFWRPNGSGYTTSLEDAGRFTAAEARAIASGCDSGARAVRRADLKPRSVVHLNTIEGAWDAIRAWRKGHPFG